MSDSSELPQGALAVVGMVGRFPGARTVDDFWENLCAGREGVRFFSPDELDPAIPASVRNDPLYVRAKGVVDDFDKFDAPFFDVSPLEAQVMDPQQRLLLELSWAALEHAGHPPSGFDGLVGVYVGMNWTRYRTHCVASHPEVIARFGDFNASLVNEAEFLATRISYKLNLRGPSVTIGTACSTSLVAIAQASQALLNFECDMALAGGASIAVPVNAGYLYQEGSMLSSDGHCRSFDASSTGTTFNDGAGVVVLRRLEDAIADRDHIYAVVRGFAVNNDGGDKVSFTAPSVGGQEAVIRSALDYAGIDPATIGSIEAHGTATPLGDPIEVAALRRVFADAKRKGARCALGSVKSSIGHVVHAAGVAGFIKAVLSVYHGKIPPTLFFEKPNPRLQLEDTSFYVNTTLEEWVTKGHPRRAGVSSFGVGGTNAHVIVEQPPVVSASGSAFAGPRVLTLSAKSEDGLARQIDALRGFVARGKNVPTLDAAAHMLQTAREPFAFRAAVVARSISDVVDALADKRRLMKDKAIGHRATAFMFTGQGSQRFGMGRWLYEHNAVFRRWFDRGADLLVSRGAVDVRKALFAPGGEADIDQTQVVQPALYLLEYSLARVLQDAGVSPSALLGHSVGEFVAAALADVFSFEDGLYLVAKRGEAMQQMPRGSMTIVYAGESVAAAYLTPEISLAAANAPDLSVLAGPESAIEHLEQRLTAAGLKYKRLRTSHAFHSAMMDPAVEMLRAIVGDVALSAPKRVVISTVTGKPLTADQAVDPSYWARQLREPVRFAAALDTLGAMGDFALVEVGPGSSLTTLALQHPSAERWVAVGALPGAGVDDAADIEVKTAVARCWISGAPVDWPSQWADGAPHRHAMPTYQFARTRHWLDQPPAVSAPAAVASGAVVAAPVPVPAAQLVAPVGGTNGAHPVVTPATVESTAMSQSNRRDALERRVIKVLEETSGYDVAGADREASYSELGFDSLLLTQVSTALKQEFGLDVTFRALMEDYGSIGELTAYLDSALPADAVPAATPAPAPVPAMAAVPAPLAAPQFSPVFTGSVPMVTQGIQSDISALIDNQLAVMRMQLQLLAGGAPVAAVAQPMAQAAAMPVAVVAPAVEAPAAAAASAAAPATAAEEGEQPKKHTPGTRIERNRTAAKQLTRTQQTFIDGLIARYTAATAASKAYTQRYRKVLADPRTVSGFNPLWKEMVYPIVTNRSKGSKVWDLDGREYVDYTNGFGPIFFGHSPEFVTEAVLKQIEEGIETGPQSPLAGEVAELFCEITGNERVAFTNTGSEAVLAALRLSRTVTGRDKVVMFEGAYHGIIDEVVVRAGKQGAGLPATPGVPRSHTANMIVLPYGKEESLARIRELAPELAAVIVETVQSRHPGLQPLPFLRELRSITAESGTALIFDEVVSGFRSHPGGLQNLFEIRADMAVYGKVVAGGYPVGLIGGKARFLDALDGGAWQYGDDSIPEIGVTFFAGTFVRHPVSLAAMKAVLLRLKAEGPELQATLGERTAAMANELRDFFKSVNANVSIENFTSYFYLSVGPNEPYGSLLFYLIRLYGIHAWEFRPYFLTTSHTDADVAKFTTAVKRAVSEMVAHGLLQGDPVAVERLNAPSATTPPVEGARLGKDKDGAPAWFVPDPNRPGKYTQLNGQFVS